MKIDPITRINIKDAIFSVLVGVEPSERLSPQEVVADISFEYDGSLAAQTDVLVHAVDYASLHARISERVSSTQFFLLERLGAFILDIIMEDTRIFQATVILGKTAVLPKVGVVSVRMTMHRTSGVAPILRCY